MLDLHLWKEQKKALKLTLQDIADQTGISISTIKDIFRGATTDPRIETVQRIETVLGIIDLYSPPARALIKLRRNNGLTQKEMAKKLGIPYHMYALTEGGYMGLNAANMRMICETFGVSMSDLLGAAEDEILEIVENDVERTTAIELKHVDFILSNANSDERFDYYFDLNEFEQELFINLLLLTKEDLIDYREKTILRNKTSDKLLDYQERPYLWKNNNQ